MALPKEAIISRGVADGTEAGIPVNGVSSKNLNNFGKMGRAEKRIMIFIRRDIAKQKQRQQTSEHPFGTIKHYDGAGYAGRKGLI